MSVEKLRASGWLLFEAVAGSRAYHLHGPDSDTDLKGIYILPLEERLRWEYSSQIASERNDEVYWELDKFLQLLARANPSALELLYSPAECIRLRHPLMDRIKGNDFLTRECKDSFAGYALGQIKKAKGLHKKIANPQPEKRLGVMDFCKVVDGGRSLELPRWLAENRLHQEQCGLAALNGFLVSMPSMWIAPIVAFCRALCDLILTKFVLVLFRKVGSLLSLSIGMQTLTRTIAASTKNTGLGLQSAMKFVFRVPWNMASIMTPKI